VIKILQSILATISKLGLTLVCALMVYLVAILGLVGVAYFYTPSLVQVLKFDQPEGLVVKTLDNKQLSLYPGLGRYQKISIEDAPPVLVKAFLSLEDREYFENVGGFQVDSTAKNMTYCILQGFRGCAGGSGISQQLVKNTTFQNERTFRRKVNESLINFKLNLELSKYEILEAYMNQGYFGLGTYGVASASDLYFGFDADEKRADGKFRMNANQACILASIVQRPNFFSRGLVLEDENNLNVRLLNQRKDYCISSMNEIKIPFTNPDSVYFDDTSDNLSKFDIVNYRAVNAYDSVILRRKVLTQAGDVESRPSPEFLFDLNQRVVQKVQAETYLLEDVQFFINCNYQQILDDPDQCEAEELFVNLSEGCQRNYQNYYECLRVSNYEVLNFDVFSGDKVRLYYLVIIIYALLVLFYTYLVFRR
jgi:hypothetical protein